MDKVLSEENISFSKGAGRGVSLLLMALGAVLIGLTLIGGLSGDAAAAKVALHAYHVGFLVTLGVPLGAMAIVMILNVTNSGWSASVKRQFENAMFMLWLPAVLFVGEIVLWLVLSGKHDGIYLWKWMNPDYIAGDIIYQKKAPYLNTTFFYIRAAVYFGVWLLLSMGLWGLSTRQDSDGNKWHTVSARRLSSVGLLLFAFTTAFASFDWIMSLDHHWFSTMMPVWFFAGNMVSGFATVILIMLFVRYFGRMHVLFTNEHLHDLGKLLFGFTVFWAYISFSQYFLIWYANIPEETAYFMRRKTPGTIWETLSFVIPICHFIVPFVWLMARPARRSPLAVGIACVWLLGCHVIDMFWMVRPEAMMHTDTAHHASIDPSWIDAVGIGGPVLLFVGLLIAKVASGVLLAKNDPRLPEALHHKNYI
jgi:hypothetical protein